MIPGLSGFFVYVILCEVCLCPCATCLFLWPILLKMLSLFFSEVLDSNRNLKTVKNDTIRFSRKNLSWLLNGQKWLKMGQKWLSWYLKKFCHYFLLEVTEHNIHYNSMFSCANPIPAGFFHHQRNVPCALWGYYF